MKKNIVLIIGGLVLLGVVAFFVLSKKSPSPLTTMTTSTTPTPTAQANAAMTLKDLMGKGVAQTCTFSTTMTQGVVYVDSGKARGDFASTVNGKVYQIHMIVDGTTYYMWRDGQTSGFKAAFNPANVTASEASPAANGALDANQSLVYNCKPGVTDPSSFTIPATVTFTEIAVPSSASSSSNNQCSVCANLPASAKGQCLSALHCE